MGGAEFRTEQFRRRIAQQRPRPLVANPSAEGMLRERATREARSAARLSHPTVITVQVARIGLQILVVAAAGVPAALALHLRLRARSPYLSPVVLAAGIAALTLLPLVHFDDTWHALILDPAREHLSWALVTSPSALWLLTAGGLLRSESRWAYVLRAAVAILPFLYLQLDQFRNWAYVPPRETSYLATAVLVLAAMAFRLRASSREAVTDELGEGGAPSAQGHSCAFALRLVTGSARRCSSQARCRVSRVSSSPGPSLGPGVKVAGRLRMPLMTPIVS